MKELPEINPNQAITLDLETCDPELKFTGPGYISGVGFVAGIAIAADEGSWYIPIRHAKGENYDKEEVVKWLNNLCSADTPKIFHNAQYDLGWLSDLGVELHGTIFDTMLAAPLLNENRFSYELDSLGKIYCDEGKFEEALKMAVAEEFADVRTHKTIIRLKEDSPCNNYQPFIDAKTRVSQFYDLWPDDVKAKYDVLGIEKDSRGHETYKVPARRQADVKGLLWAVDPEEMGTYPIQDVDLTRKLAKIFAKEIQEENLSKVMDLECELLLPLLEMRIHGVRIDMEKAVELDIKYSKEIQALQAKLNELCGFEVDVNIDADLIKICEKFNLKYSKTEKGNPCFSSEAVPKDDLGIFNTILQIRKYFKARDTYIRGYIFGSTFNGWLHGQYNQLKSDEGGTVTGRLSSSSPNMQNMPNPKSSDIGVDIRGLFLPDNKSEMWLSLDYSGQEPKMMVHTVLALHDFYKKLATSPKENESYFPGALLAMTPEFRGRDADFHTAVATICMKKELDMERVQYTPEQLKAKAKEFRPKAKSIGLGVMYGSGNKKVAEEMTKKGFFMTTDQAAEIRANIYEGVPFLDALNKHLVKKALDRGYIKTILGRRGHFDLWECPCWDNEQKKAIGTDNLNFKSREDAYLWYNENVKKYDALKRPQRAYTYKALNKYIQGSSADQTKTAMLHLYKRNNLSLNALDIFYRRVPDFVPPKFKTQVHDEINVSITKGESAQWYQQVMENCLPLKVEVVADPVVCTKWSEAK